MCAGRRDWRKEDGYVCAKKWTSLLTDNNLVISKGIKNSLGSGCHYICIHYHYPTLRFMVFNFFFKCWSINKTTSLNVRQSITPPLQCLSIHNATSPMLVKPNATSPNVGQSMLPPPQILFKP